MAITIVLVTSAAHAQAPPRGSGRVEVVGPVRVIDGDTLDLVIDGKRVGVGLLGIKAPNGNTKCGKVAIAALEALTSGRLELVEDLDHTFDARKRRMYYVRLPNGTSAAVELARAGLVVPDGKGIEKDELDMAAKAAKAAKAGCAL